MISVITATFNSANVLRVLYDSLKCQSDMQFEWIIIDGKSSDSTISVINSFTGLDIKFVSEPDKGIYDAINKGIRASKYDYYLVCGSDDYFLPNAIKNLKAEISKNITFDFYACSFLIKDKVYYPQKNLSWLNGMRGISSCHSVALLIRKTIHDNFGFYNLDFPVLADQYFVQKALFSGCSIKYCKYIVAGQYSINGISSLNSLDKQIDFFKMQLFFNRNLFVQLCLFTYRILKYKYF
jgi:glycosyltransferase involved in cell wall biosynthesis